MTTQANPTKTEKTICLFLENKFGALEKVIGTFSLRGFEIENLVCTKNKVSNVLNVKISMICTDFELEKLVKVLSNQIYVLDIDLTLEGEIEKFQPEFQAGKTA